MSMIDLADIAVMAYNDHGLLPAVEFKNFSGAGPQQTLFYQWLSQHAIGSQQADVAVTDYFTGAIKSSAASISHLLLL